MRFLSAWLKSWFFDQKFFLHFAGFFVDTTDPSFRRRGEMSEEGQFSFLHLKCQETLETGITFPNILAVLLSSILPKI